MYDGGYIKIYRSLLKWEWYNDINTKTLFFHLLLTANYEDKKWQGIVVKRGQRIASYSTLSQETYMSVRSVRTSLKHLKSTGEVTSTTTSKYSIITVNNYDKFQEVTDLLTNNRQTADKRPTSDRQQLKNIKNIKNDIYIGKNDLFSEYSNGCVELLEAFKAFEEMRKSKKKPMTDNARKLLISALEKISTDKPTQIKVLNNSTLNGWSSVYPLKNENTKPIKKRLGNFETNELENLFLKPKVIKND